MQVPLIVEPDPSDDDCAILCIDGAVGGRSCRFVLDSGAARSQVVADEYTAPLSRRRADSSIGAFGPASSALVVLPEVRVGTIAMADLEVNIVDPTEPRASSLLGMDFLRFHSLELNFDQRLVTLGEPAPQSASLPLDLSTRSHPYIDVKWGGLVARGVWDTGASMTIVSQELLDTQPRLFTPAGSTTGTDANGGQQQTPTFLVEPCRIGGQPFATHRVAVVDLHQVDNGLDLILGYTTIRQANWYFDFPARNWGAWSRLNYGTD